MPITQNLKEISERVRRALDALTLPDSIEERPAREARLREAERASVCAGRGGMRKRGDLQNRFPSPSL